MTNQQEHMDFEEMCKQTEQSQRRGKVVGGILVVAAGSLFLAKELGADIPHWLFSWKTFLIALGIITGVKHNFRNAWWFFLVAIGGIFLLGDFYPMMNIKPFIWPVLIILFGLMMIFKPRRKFNHRRWAFAHHRYNRYGQQDNCCVKEDSVSEDYVESTSFMGGVKKNVLSKKFKGADITNVFGGAEINLSQADMESTATMELTNVFGGTKLIIPAHWEINSELVSVFGSIEDKRPMQPNTVTVDKKVLILRGTTFMGGIDIKSY
jgi:predicted membrane protein